MAASPDDNTGPALVEFLEGARSVLRSLDPSTRHALKLLLVTLAWALVWRLGAPRAPTSINVEQLVADALALGVHVDASPEEIRLAYYRRCQQLADVPGARGRLRAAATRLLALHRSTRRGS